MGREEPVSYYNSVFHSSPLYNCPPEAAPWFGVWSAILDVLDEDDTILDLGCGPGQFAELALKRGFGYWMGIDYSMVAIQLAVFRNPCCKSCFEVGSLYDDGLWGHLRKKADQYTAVVMCEVLEHLSLDTSVVWSIPSGKKVVLTVPNYGGTGHVRYFERAVDVMARYGDYLKEGSHIRCVMMPRETHGNNAVVYVLSGVRK